MPLLNSVVLDNLIIEYTKTNVVIPREYKLIMTSKYDKNGFCNLETRNLTSGGGNFKFC